MYSVQKEQKEQRTSLPSGDEFESLLKRLNSNEIEEKVKIAIAGRYFSIGNEEAYKRVLETVSPKSTEDYTLKNNQDIIVHLVKYNKEQKIEELQDAKKLITKTYIFPTVKTMFLLSVEAAEDEILRESYKLDRTCKYSATLKAISFINARKYEEASSIIERLPVSLEKTVLELLIAVSFDKEKAQSLYARLREQLEIQEKKPESKIETHIYREYAKRLINEGAGIGLDLIISKTSEKLKTSTGIALGSAKQLLEQTSDPSSEAVPLLNNSKKLFLEIEILRAQELLKKKRYIEAKELALTLKKNENLFDPSAAERIAIVLISSSLNQNQTENLDIPWIVNSLSAREQKKKDTGLSDLIELIKIKTPETISLDSSNLAWIKKMIRLSKNTNLIWKPVIEESKYLNRLGNIYFAQKKIDKAKEAYEEALKTSSKDDTGDIKENIKKMKKWISRKDAVIAEFPEGMCLFRAQGYSTANPSMIEYINNTTHSKTLMETADALEEIANTLAKDNEKEKNTERIVNILSLCSLVKFRKQILTPSEIAESNISVIYNHIVFWISEDIELDMSVVNEAISYYTSKYATGSQRLLAKEAILQSIAYFAKKGRVKRFNEVLTRIEGHIKGEIEDMKEIRKMKSMLEEINTPFDEENEGGIQENHNVPEETEIKQKKQEDSAEIELLSKREEVMRMLTESTQSGKKHNKKPKRVRAQEEEIKPSVKKQKQKEERTFVPIKKASHTVISSDEDD